MSRKNEIVISRDAAHLPAGCLVSGAITGCRQSKTLTDWLRTCGVSLNAVGQQPEVSLKQWSMTHAYKLCWCIASCSTCLDDRDYKAAQKEDVQASHMS